MKKILILLICYVSTTSLLLSQSIYPEHEIIVKFKPANIMPPQGKTKGNLEEFQISSPDLLKLLQNFKVKIVSRLISSFSPEERFDTNRAGELVELIDWKNTYLLQLDLKSSSKD